MAKAIVLKCDTCGEWDTDENKVQTIGVAGPRFDLCAYDRAKLIEHMGVAPDKAAAYVSNFDKRKATRGMHPGIGLADAPEAVEGDQEAPEAAEGVAEGLEMDDEPAPEETEVKAAGSRSRRK